MRTFLRPLRRRFLLLSAAFSGAVSPSQAWYSQSPNPTDKPLREVVFAGGETAWILGDGTYLGEGTFLKTVDGGLTWFHAPALAPGQETLGMRFIGPDTGYALAATEDAFGGLNQKKWLRTVDGGKTWSTRALANTAVVGGILRFSDAMNGFSLFVQTTATSITKTTDGGVTWTSLVTHGGRLFDLHAADRSRAWAVGEGGTILATADGGTTWTRQTSGITGTLRSVQFLDAGTGWCSGDAGTLLKTVDGGATWTRVQAPNATEAYTSIRFTDKDHGFIGCFPGGYGKTVLRTSDGGARWESITVPMDYPKSGIAVAFRDARLGLVVGLHGALFRTDDGGTTWSNRGGGALLEIYKMAMLDARTGWACGSNGTLVKTEDGGFNWVQQKQAPGTIISAIQFLDARRGFFSSFQGIYKTRDGGATWAYKSALGTTDDFWFGDSLRGWSVGKFGGMVRTVDGGETWTRPPEITRAHLAAVHFADASHGMVVGERGLVLRTRDGGSTWDSSHVAGNRDLLAVRMKGPDTAWIGGETDSLYKTTDGGATWKGMNLRITNGFSASDDVTGIHFSADGRFGGVCGSDGNVILTRDGGATWFGSPQESNARIKAIQVVGQEDIWMGGANGLILRYGTRPVGPSGLLSWRGPAAELEIHRTAPGTLAYRLGAGGRVSIRLIDAAGRGRLLFDASQGPGPHAFDLPPPPAGPAWLDIRAGGARRAVRIR